MSKLTIPLYHGTDRKLLYLSKEQREYAKASTFNLIHYFADVYVKNEFEFKDYHISAFEKKKNWWIITNQHGILIQLPAQSINQIINIIHYI